MGVNYDDSKYQLGNYFLPKIGEKAEFEIVEFHEVKSDKPKLNFSKKEKILLPDGSSAEKTTDLGYHVEATLKNEKKLIVTNLAAFINVFKNHGIQDGDHIIVEHPAQGEWKVTKL
jgi:hypothetical protein